MPANIPRQFATIDLRDGSTRPATADESSLLEPDSLSGLPGAPKIVGRHGQRAWTQTDDASPISPGRLHFADAAGREIRCAAVQCADGIVPIYWSEDQHSIVYLRLEGMAKRKMAFYRWSPAPGVPSSEERCAGKGGVSSGT